MAENSLASNGVDKSKTREEQAEEAIQRIAKRFGPSARTPLLKTPADVGLEYEPVTFPASDGIILEAWYIPKSGSNKLVIVNHPRWFNRYGLPGHIEPWRSIGGFADPDNAVEVNLVPDLKILHDSGYNVLTYDERNFGHSSAANGGLTTAGRYEARDVVGSLQYVRGREELKSMQIGLFSRCNGANATFFAMQQNPEEFKDVRCYIACQPLSIGCIGLRALENFGLKDFYDRLNEEVQLITSFKLEDMSPVPWAASCNIPTFIYQVKDDKMTYSSDVQSIFDNIKTNEKELQWIENTGARWNGYLEFQRRPEPMLNWLNKYMK